MPLVRVHLLSPLLSICLLAVASTVTVSELQAVPSHAPQAVPAQALAAQIAQPGANPPLLLDVRTRAEFDQGHIPNAVLIPHDQLQARLAELDPACPIVVDRRTGRRAGIAERLMAAQGDTVAQLEGSWAASRGAGLPEVGNRTTQS